MKIRKNIWLLFTLTLLANSSLNAAPEINWSHQKSSVMLADKIAIPERLPVIAAHCAGDRVIAVGEYGSVMLVDPANDKTRQASSVPTRAPLTDVNFIDQRHGWAVGHEGVILQTRDGGDNWTLLQADEQAESYFSVLFLDEKKGFIGGRFATMMRTEDGGESWNPLQISDDPDAEQAHIFDLFTDGKGKIYAASEFGNVLVTDNEGDQWQTLETGFGGTFWAGIADDSGLVIAVGMVGTIYRSEDFGETWANIDVNTPSSFTDIQRMNNGDIVAVGLNGVVATSMDQGRTFTIQQRDDRAALTAVGCGADASPVLFAKSGRVQ